MNAGCVDPVVAYRSTPAWQRGACIVFVAALAAIVGAMLREPGIVDAWTMLHWIAKPLASATLVVLVARCAPLAPAKLRRAVLVGLACSLAGDVLLMISPRLFVAGLVAFLVAHLSYLRAFSQDTKCFANRPALLVLAATGTIVLAGLWNALPGPLKAPVFAYVVVIVAMAAQAFARARLHPSPGANAAAVGAALFVVSDSLLAIDRFRTPIPASPLWVLGTYWLAQWGIAQSVREAASPSGRGVG